MKQIKLIPPLLTLTASLLTSQVTAGDWPQWRGADRTDIAKEGNLLKKWPEGGPAKVWSTEEAGLGYSGFSVVNGRLYTMGLFENEERILAFDAATGKKIWAKPAGEKYPNKWGDGPRATPTVAGDKVLAMGGQGTLVCLKTSDGSEIWRASMKDLGGSVATWGYCESVLVDGNKVICTPGGSKGAIAALDLQTGKVLWQSADFTDAAQYSSIVPMDFGGKRQYVQLTMKSIVGINAEDGKVAWKSNFPGRVAVIPTPIVNGDHVYVTAGYGVGCKLVKVTGAAEASDVYENKVMKNHHGGVILVGEHLYGHSDGPGWICQNFKTGEEVWASKSLGKGAVACADGMLYCVDEGSGTVVLAEASPKGWQEHGRFKIDPQTKQRSPDGRIWTHPVISNGRLYLRDQELIHCYNISAK